MTLLTNRNGRATATQSSHDHGTQVAPNVTLSHKPKRPAAESPPRDALLTLRSRLQTQLETNDGHEDLETRLILESAHRRLEQVNIALSMIDEDKYGTCTICYKPIENERLVLLPFSTRCVSCQTVADWQGRG